MAGSHRKGPTSKGNMMADVPAGIHRLRIGAIAAVLSVAVLAGCTGPVGAPQWWDPYLTVDSDLETFGLTELRMTRSRTESGFLRVVGEYVNRSDATLSAVFRFTWLDAAGQPVKSILSNWQAVHALAGTRSTFAGIAPRDDIEDFRVELMAAHRLTGTAAPADTGQ